MVSRDRAARQGAFRTGGLWGNQPNLTNSHQSHRQYRRRPSLPTRTEPRYPLVLLSAAPNTNHHPITQSLPTCVLGTYPNLSTLSLSTHLLISTIRRFRRGPLANLAGTFHSILPLLPYFLVPLKSRDTPTTKILMILS